MTSLDLILEGTPLDESAWIAVGDLCAWLRVEPRWVVSLVDAGVLEPRGAGPEAWLFPASDVVRARAIARLLRDLDVNLEGAAPEAQVGALAVTLTITLSALGGLLVPSFVMPAWMLTLAKLTPHYWALQGYHDAMLRGADAAGVVAEAAVLLGYATAFFGLALGRAASR